MNADKVWTALAIQSKAAPYKAGLLAFLTLVFVVVVVRLVWSGPEAAEAALPAGAIATVPAPQATVSPQPSATALSKRPSLPALAETTRRDLFRADWLAPTRSHRPTVAAPVNEHPESRDKSDSTELVLELTFTGAVDARLHCAVINGTRVRPGDSIQGLTVDSITPGLVVLSTRTGERIMLRMN